MSTGKFVDFTITVLTVLTFSHWDLVIQSHKISNSLTCDPLFLFISTDIKENNNRYEFHSRKIEISTCPPLKKQFPSLPNAPSTLIQRRLNHTRYFIFRHNSWKRLNESAKRYATGWKQVGELPAGYCPLLRCDESRTRGDLSSHNSDFLYFKSFEYFWIHSIFFACWFMLDDTLIIQSVTFKYISLNT